MVAVVAVVAQAVLGSSANWLDRERASLMVAAAVLVLLVPRVWAQLLALVFGGLVGLCARTPPELEPPALEPFARNVSWFRCGVRRRWFGLVLCAAVRCSALVVC